MAGKTLKLTLTEAQDEVLDRLAALGGSKKQAVLRKMIELQAEGLARLVADDPDVLALRAAGVEWAPGMLPPNVVREEAREIAEAREATGGRPMTEEKLL
jgi:hypothetical protein